MRTPSSSRIIGAESLTGVRRFTLSDLAGVPVDGDQAAADGAAAAAPDAAHDPVFEAGRAQGVREGIRQGLEAAREQAAGEAARRGEQAVQELAARAARLSASLEEQFSALRHSVADELVELAIEIARRTVGETVQSDRGLVVGIAREAVAALLDERSSFALHVNPNDKPLVEHAMADLLAARGARCIADPSIGAGGCRVVAPGAVIDSTTESRWRRVVASMGREAPALADPGVL
jgi:flagellar assembly protein FliH